MNNAIYNFPVPENETVLDYLKGSKERIDLDNELKRQEGEVIEIPLIIGGKEIHTSNTGHVTSPHNTPNPITIAVRTRAWGIGSTILSAVPVLRFSLSRIGAVLFFTYPRATIIICIPVSKSEKPIMILIIFFCVIAAQIPANTSRIPMIRLIFTSEKIIFLIMGYTKFYINTF